MGRSSGAANNTCVLKGAEGVTQADMTLAIFNVFLYGLLSFLPTHKGSFLKSRYT